MPWSCTSRFRKEYRLIRSLTPLLTTLLLAGPALGAELDGTLDGGGLLVTDASGIRGNSTLGGKRVGGFALKRGGPCTS